MKSPRSPWARSSQLAACLGLLLVFILSLSSGCTTGSSGSGLDSGAGAAAGGTALDSSGQSSTNNLWVDELRPGDRILVVYSGIPVPPPIHQEEIRPDGSIEPPYLSQRIQAAGKSATALQRELQQLYVPAIFKSITITVKVEERYFFVGGEVKIPGQKPYLSAMTLIKAIQAAGDFTDFADRSSVLITRADRTQIEVNWKKAIKNPRLNVPVYPGDQIHVRRRFP